MTMVLLLLVLVVLVLAIFASLPGQKMTPVKRGHLDRQFVERKWTEIQAKAGGQALAQAVSDADKLLDYALKNSGVRGETMGERLKNSGNRFSDINGVWRAHKLRNSLAHEAQFDLVATQAREALNDFERGLKDLGAL